MDQLMINSEIKREKGKQSILFQDGLEKYRIDIYRSPRLVKIFRNDEVILEQRGQKVLLSDADGSDLVRVSVENNMLFGTGSPQVSIWLRGIPLENTMADPDQRIKQSKGLYIVLMIIMGLKIFIGPVLDVINGGSYLYSMLGNLIIYGPVLILLGIFFALLKRIPLASLIVGLIIAVFELGDYVYGLAMNLAMLEKGGTYIWVIFRVSILIMFIKSVASAVRDKRKMKSES